MFPHPGGAPTLCHRGYPLRMNEDVWKRLCGFCMARGSCAVFQRSDVLLAWRPVLARCYNFTTAYENIVCILVKSVTYKSKYIEFLSLRTGSAPLSTSPFNFGRFSRKQEQLNCEVTRFEAFRSNFVFRYLHFIYFRYRRLLKTCKARLLRWPAILTFKWSADTT